MPYELLMCGFALFPIISFFIGWLVGAKVDKAYVAIILGSSPPLIFWFLGIVLLLMSSAMIPGSRSVSIFATYGVAGFTSILIFSTLASYLGHLAARKRKH